MSEWWETFVLLHLRIKGLLEPVSKVIKDDGLRVSCSGRGTTSAEDGQGTPTQSHISPSILVYEENKKKTCWGRGGQPGRRGRATGQIASEEGTHQKA